MLKNASAQLLSLIQTSDRRWMIPARVLVGVMLIAPIGGSLADIISFCDHPEAGSVCYYLLWGEKLVGFSFVTGCLIRLLSPVVIAAFALHAVSEFGLAAGLPQPLLGFLHLHDGFVYGATYVGLITLVLDLAESGAGALSIDQAITRKFVPKDG